LRAGNGIEENKKMKKINSSSIISILFLLGILILINAIGIRNFVRLDLTSSRMYTLSKASKNIVSKVEDKVFIKAYISPNLPAPYNNTERYLRDILEDYRAYSKGHLTYEFIDPGSEEKLEKEAQSFRIPPKQFQVVQNDKIEVKMGYLGVVFIYGDKKEVIPVVENVANLEYEITSLINRLTAKKLPRLGVASTGSEDKKVTMQKLYEALGRNFDVQPLSVDEPISKDFDVVFLIAPRAPLTDWQLFNIDQYLMNGGKFGVFANSYEAYLQQGFANKRDLKLKDFLTNYGIALNEDMVFDNECGAVSVPRRQGFFTFNQQVNFPYLVYVLNPNRQNVITRTLQNVQMFFPSSVDTTIAMTKGYKVEGLLYSSKLSGRELGQSVAMDITRRWQKTDFTEKYIPLAAIVTGKFTSYFAKYGPPNRPLIYVKGAVDTVGTKYDGPFKTAADAETRLLVVGDGNMALDEYIFTAGAGDIMFIQNAADYMVQTQDLISIRSKQLMMKPLKDVPNFGKKIIKWANQIGPVILVVILGIVLWQVRRLRKKTMAAAIQSRFHVSGPVPEETGDER
jgi:gliding-associated putative ABC transporter substrate-binding component GldG